MECTDAGSVPTDIGVLRSDADVEITRVKAFKCGCRMLSKKVRPRGRKLLQPVFC